MLEVPHVQRKRNDESSCNSILLGEVEGGSKTGHFVAVELHSMPGSPYHWAIKRTLSKVIDKKGVYRERAGVKEEA